MDKVGTGTQRPGGFRRGDELARGDHPDPILQARASQGVNGDRQGLRNRQGHMVQEGLGGRARAALAAIYREEIRGVLGTPAGQGLAKIDHEAVVAQGCLHPDGTACQVAKAADPVQQLVDVGDVRVPVGTD